MDVYLSYIIDFINIDIIDIYLTWMTKNIDITDITIISSIMERYLLLQAFFLHKFNVFVIYGNEDDNHWSLRKIKDR